MRDAKPLLALFAVQASFASLAIAGKIVLRGLPPFAVAGLRVFLASLFLAALVLARRRETVPPKDLLRLFGLSLLGIVLNQVLFLEGLSKTTAINASILVATIPVFTTAIAVAVGQERARPARLAGIAVALAGVLFVLDVRRFQLSDQNLVGDILVVVNALSYSFYLVYSRDLLRRYASSTVVLWTFLFGSLLLFPIAIIELDRIPLATVSSETWWALAWIVAIPSVLAYSLNNYALKRIRPSTVAAFVFLQPLIAVGLALLLLEGETVGARTAIGGLLILAGVTIVSRNEAVEPVAAIPESGEAMSRQPIAATRAGPEPQPQEDPPRGGGQEAP